MLCCSDEKEYYPLTSLDIVCHEIGHAITKWRGGALQYRKQSGGMNEAYSDILGELSNLPISYQLLRKTIDK